MMDSTMMAFCSAHLGNVVSYRRMSTAMTNIVYFVVCADRKTYLIKFYGRTPTRKDKSFFDALAESLVDMEQEALWAGFLSEHGIGPKIIESAVIGRIEEYLQNIEAVSSEMMRDSKVVDMTVSALAEFHSIPINSHTSPENVVLWTRLQTWCDKGGLAMQHPQLANDAELKKLLREAKQVLAPLKLAVLDLLDSSPHASSIALCHNDLQHGNILVQDADAKDKFVKSVRIIDYDYVAVNYAAFDLANYFCEWCFDYNGSTENWRMNQGLFPDTLEQHRILSVYLQKRFGTGGTGMEEWLRMIDYMVPIAHLTWAYWLIVKAASEFDMPPEDVSFDYMSCARERLRVFLEWNERHCIK